MNRGSQSHLRGGEATETPHAPAKRTRYGAIAQSAAVRAAALAALLWVVGLGAGRAVFAAQQQPQAAKPPAGSKPQAKEPPKTQQQQLEESGNEDAGDEQMMNGEQGGERQLPGTPGARANGGVVAPPSKEIEFKTNLDHTAIWVGDQFHYTVEVKYPSKVEFVLDGLTKETVNMDPLQMVDVQKTVTPLADGRRRLVVDITLTSFITNAAAQQIPQLTLFYFKKEAGITTAQEAAAESLPIPGPTIALRSTLPPNPDEIRDPSGVNNWASSRALLGMGGWLCMVVLVAGAGWEGAQVIRKRKSYQGPDRRKAMEAVRDRWSSSIPGDFSNAERVSEFYDRSYQDLREYLGYYLETPALGLTADELTVEMQRLGTNVDLAQRVSGVLGTLESARYASDGAAALRENASKTTQTMREIFSYSVPR